jgi:hypothetical protein
MGIFWVMPRLAPSQLSLDRIIWFLCNFELARGLTRVIAHFKTTSSKVDAIGAKDGALADASISETTSHKIKRVNTAKWTKKSPRRPLSEERFCHYKSAVRAFEVVHRKVTTGRVRRYGNEFYWLAALRTGVIHKQVKRHSGASSGTDSRPTRSV